MSISTQWEKKVASEDGRFILGPRRYALTTALQPATAGRALWVRWTIASVISYFVSHMVDSAVVYPVVDAVDVGITIDLHLVLAGLGLGLLQWLILRRYIAQAHRWMWVTIGAAVVGSVGYTVIQLSVQAIFSTFTFEGIIGRWIMVSTFVWWAAVVGLTGMLQWLVLRRQVPRAGWWIIATVAAHLFGVVAVFGAVTGAALVWLLRQPVIPAKEGIQEIPP
jgi:hypothetical protein